MAVAALTYDPGTNVIDIDATIPADTPDEASIFELRPATPGGFSKVWHSASKNQTIKVAGAPQAFSLHHRVTGTDEREVWTIAADGTTAAGTEADGEGRGAPYDHSAVDHGPDGPVDDGDANFPPNPLTNAVPGPASASTFATVPDPYDPADHTSSEVKDYILGLGDESDPAVIAETQRVKDFEVAGRNRSGLVSWLAARDGVI